MPVVVPLLGVTNSQLPPLTVVAVAVKLTETGVLETVIVCAGPLPPAPCVKVRPAEGEGEAVIVPAFTGCRRHSALLRRPYRHTIQPLDPMD